MNKNVQWNADTIKKKSKNKKLCSPQRCGGVALGFHENRA